MERTLIFFKPNITLNNESINALMFFKNESIFISRYELQRYPESFFKKFYAHITEPPRSQHSKFCCSGLIGVAILEGEGVVEKVRKTIGSTADSSKAEPKTLRGYFYQKYKPKVGYDNFIHASATREDAEREIKIFFGGVK